MLPFAGWERIEMARDQFDDVFDVDGDEVIFPPLPIISLLARHGKISHSLAKYAIRQATHTPNRKIRVCKGRDPAINRC
jgi:hypothetical protein